MFPFYFNFFLLRKNNILQSMFKIIIMAKWDHCYEKYNYLSIIVVL